jgi:GNAT superfamily N-acetyltransferase
MRTNNITIRSATVDDVPLILGFVKALAEYEHLSHEVEATEEQLRETLFGEGFDKAGEPSAFRRTAEVVIAHVNDAPAGFALFFHNYSTFLAKPGMYLEDLFVNPEFRGNGVGKALLVYLARLAVERGCGRLEWSVLDWNTPAIEFYQRLGARPMDEWTVFRLTGDTLAQLAAEVE